MKVRLVMGKIARWCLVLGLLAGGMSLHAQDEDDFEEMSEDTACVPANLQTAYDAYKTDDLAPNQLDIWYDYGREPHKIARYENKPEKYRQAIPYFWKVIVNDDTGRFKIVYGKLVECYLGLNEPDSALIVAYRGLAKYPDYITLHYHAGIIQKTLGKVKCAIPHYEALVNSNPDDKSTLLNYLTNLAQLYYAAEDERCLEVQRRVIDLDPENVEAASLLVRMTEFFGGDAMEAMEDAYNTDPTNIQNARRFGRAAYEAGEYDKAIQAYTSVLEQDPANTEALRYIARSYEGKEQFANALKNYKAVLDLEAEDLNVMCSIASVYARTRDFTTARAYVRRVQRIDASFGWSYMVMGEIYENSVAKCSDERDKRGYTYDDKLVFQLAQDEYRKAARDPNVAASASLRVKQLEPFVPTKADLHMHSNRTDINDSCYSWIGQ